MKIRINREGLLRAWSAVAGVVPTKSPKPILQSIKLTNRHGDGEATLSATDLEVGIVYRVPLVDADDAGSVILPPRVGEILKKSADDEITIEVDGDQLTVSGLRSKFVLPSEDPNLFPTVPEFDAADYFEVPAASFRAAVHRTAFATDVDSTRYALGGVLVETDGNNLTLVGTDGRRRAQQKVYADRVGSPQDCVNGDKKFPAPVVPPKTLKLLEKVIDPDGPPVHIAINPFNSILFRTEEAVIYSRLVEGRFPRYHDVFPPAAEQTITMPVRDLLGGTQQASILTSDESRGVDFEFAPGVLSMASQAADRGSSRVEVPTAYDGPAFGFTLDPEYLTSMLRVLDADLEIELKFAGAKNGLLFGTDDSYKYVAMPLTRDR